MHRQKFREATIYNFRDALITYNRAQGFKNPIESADKTIEKFLFDFTYCGKPIEEIGTPDEGMCGVVLDCHLHDWRAELCADRHDLSPKEI